MKSTLHIVITFTALCSLLTAVGQRRYSCDTIPDRTHKFKYTQLILPVGLMTVGIIGLESHWILHENEEIRYGLQKSIDKRVSIDNFLQYTPAVAVYGLNLCGVRGVHNFRDRTILLAISYALVGITVNTIKGSSHVWRPDGSKNNSFPSGHTATAFMSAEFMRMEYKNASPWIGIAGYSVAVMTGAFRMYNNRHWLNDVLMGAGIGIMSTKIAYWIYPPIYRLLFRKSDRRRNSGLIPFFDGRNTYLSFSATF